jgi:Gram-negative porin
VKILNNLKCVGACLGLFLAGSTLCRSARAEVVLVEKDGWKFSFDGRVNAFLSVGKGDDFPKATPDPANPGMNHDVMGFNKTQGIPDVGWKSAELQDTKGQYFAMRVRSGMVGNVLGFGLARQVNDTTSVKGYISIWSTIETLSRDKWAPVIPEAREGYFNVTGPWGSATVGRTFGWFGRMSTEIDMLYGHTYGVGLPCTDELGPACGHIGTGVAYPGYSAGFSYSTPSLGGLQVHAGVYDPVVFAPSWKRAPLLRPEGSVTFETKLGGSGLLKISAEGLYQPLARLVEADATAMTPARDEKTSVWGAAGGARLEIGPVRLGAAAALG